MTNEVVKHQTVIFVLFINLGMYRKAKIVLRYIVLTKRKRFISRYYKHYMRGLSVAKNDLNLRRFYNVLDDIKLIKVYPFCLLILQCRMEKIPLSAS